MTSLPPSVKVKQKHRPDLSLTDREWTSAYQPHSCVMAEKLRSAVFRKMGTWYQSTKIRWAISEIAFVDARSADRSRYSKEKFVTRHTVQLFRLIPHSDVLYIGGRIKELPVQAQSFEHLPLASHKPLLIEVISQMARGAKKVVAVAGRLLITSDATKPESASELISANDPMTFVPIVLDNPQGHGQPIVLEVLDTGDGDWPPFEYPTREVVNYSPEVSYTLEVTPEVRYKPVESTAEAQIETDEIFEECVQETGGRIDSEHSPPTYSHEWTLLGVSQDDRERIPLEEQAASDEQIPIATFGTPQEATTESSTRLPLSQQAATVFECTHISKPPPEKYLLEPFYVVVFKYAPEKFNNLMGRVFQLLARNIPFDAILANFMSTGEQPFCPMLEDSQLSQELSDLHSILSSTPDRQRRACIDLLTKFGQATEDYLLELVIPFTDAPTVNFLPFAYEQKEYLQSMVFSMLQMQLPHSLTEDEAIALLLLISKLLGECIADCGLLKAFEVEDQCFVYHSFSSYLATQNHAIEGLVKLFPDRAIAFCIIASPAEKHLKDLTDSLLNDIPRKFRSKFTLHSYRNVELFRQLSPLVAALSSSLPAQQPQVSTDGAMSIPCIDSGNYSIANSCTETATPNVCEETGVGEY